MEDTSDLEKTLEYRPAASLRPVALESAKRRRHAIDAKGDRASALPARRRVSSATLVVLLLSVFAFFGAVLATFGTGAPPPRTSSFAREAPRPAAPALASAPPASTGDVPVVDVASLPRPPIGTVIGAPKHRLWIDGRLAPSWKRTVKCGLHTVQVGSQGEEREVDVPCGGEISVSP
jgi:hypothetical protein